MVVTFAAEQNVVTYNLVIDSMDPVAITPNPDGTATYDLDPLNLAPGDHAASADACNGTGCSAFCGAVAFTIAAPIPVPDVPVITVG